MKLLIMNMPRLSIRKLFLYLLAGATCILFTINVQQHVFNSAVGPVGANSFIAGPGSSLLGGSGQRYEETGSTVTVLDLRIPAVFERPWYMKDGQVRPVPAQGEGSDRSAHVFPDELVGHDRIPEQLMYVPPVGNVPEDQESADVKLKKILLWNGINSWGGLRPGRGVFIKERCPVSTCVITSSRIESQDADLVLFKDHFTMPTFHRPMSQLWMMYLLECPLHTQMFKDKNVFNWTSTYRSDSTIVAPYERWQYYNPNVISLKQSVDHAANKTKAVAWFVSNCGARNNRLAYAKELQKHIQVDIYGACGTKKCSRSQADQCFKLLSRDYKFYLAFENSNCKDYITEKFFVNGLQNDIVPIVMGARPEDYARSAPTKSYIHVDDFEGPKQLAEYLHLLDQNDELYNEYFNWKGTGELINTKFFCRVCSLLHDPKIHTQPTIIPDVNEWWRADGTCISGSWREYDRAVQASRKAANPEKPIVIEGNQEPATDASPAAAADVAETAEPVKLEEPK